MNQTKVEKKLHELKLKVSLRHKNQVVEEIELNADMRQLTGNQISSNIKEAQSCPL